MAKRFSGIALRLIMLLGVGLMLGACSKCDIPTPWEKSISKNTLGSCHDEPKLQ